MVLYTPIYLTRSTHDADNTLTYDTPQSSPLYQRCQQASQIPQYHLSIRALAIHSRTRMIILPCV